MNTKEYEYKGLLSIMPARLKAEWPEDYTTKGLPGYSQSNENREGLGPPLKYWLYDLGQLS